MTLSHNQKVTAESQKGLPDQLAPDQNPDTDIPPFEDSPPVEDTNLPMDLDTFESLTVDIPRENPAPKTARPTSKDELPIVTHYPRRPPCTAEDTAASDGWAISDNFVWRQSAVWKKNAGKSTKENLWIVYPSDLPTTKAPLQYWKLSGGAWSDASAVRVPERIVKFLFLKYGNRLVKARTKSDHPRKHALAPADQRGFPKDWYKPTRDGEARTSSDEQNLPDGPGTSGQSGGSAPPSRPPNGPPSPPGDDSAGSNARPNPPIRPAVPKQPLLWRYRIGDEKHLIPTVAMTEENKKKIVALSGLPETAFRWVTGYVENDHPVSHVMRYVSAWHALDGILATHSAKNPIRKVLDIGGKPSMWKHHPSGDLVVCSQPILGPKDVFRQQSDCHCEFPQVCELCGGSDAALSIHSIYDIHKDDILSYLVGKPNRSLACVLHSFVEDTSTVMEMHYVASTDKVVMKSPTGSSRYEHSRCQWIWEKDYYCKGHAAMAWTSNMTTHGSHIVYFKPSIPGLTSTVGITEYQLMYEKLVPSFVHLDSPVHIGGWYFTVKSNPAVRIDMRLFNLMIQWTAGRPLTAVNYRMGITYLNRTAEKMSIATGNVAAFVTAQAWVAVGADAAAARTVFDAYQSELEASNEFLAEPLRPPSFVDRLKRLYAKHPFIATFLLGISVPFIFALLFLRMRSRKKMSLLNTLDTALRDFVRQFITDWLFKLPSDLVAAANTRTYLGGLALAHPIILALMVVKKDSPRFKSFYGSTTWYVNSAYLMWATVQLYMPFIADRVFEIVDISKELVRPSMSLWDKLAALFRRGDKQKELVLSYRNQLRQPLPDYSPTQGALVAGPCDPIVFPAYCAGRLSKIPPQNPSAYCSARFDEHRPKPGNVLCGFHMVGWTPIVCEDCTHNQYAAVVQRVTVATPHLSEEIQRRLRVDDFHWVPKLGEREFMYEHWVKHLKPKKLASYLEGVGEDPSSLENCTHELFVKRENGLKHHVAVPELAVLRPRAILTSSPIGNLVLGPDAHSLSCALEVPFCNIQDTPRFSLIYTMNATELGAHVSHVVGDRAVWWMSVDGKTMDASVAYEWKTRHARLYKHAGFSNDAQTWVDNTLILNFKTKKGLKGTNYDGFATGRQDTTLNHVLLFRQSVEDFEFPGWWHVFNKSDDNLIVVDQSIDRYAFRSAFHAHMYERGIDTSWQITEYPYASEFLSNRFMINFGLLFPIPKLGRMLSKLFYSAHPTKIKSPLHHAKTVAYGMRHLEGVPLVGPILTRTLQILDWVHLDEKDPFFDNEKYKILRPTAPIVWEYDSLVKQYCQLYGLTEQDILEMHSEIWSAQTLPFGLVHPGWNRVITIDLGMWHSPIIEHFEPASIDPDTLPVFDNQVGFGQEDDPFWLMKVLVEEAFFYLSPITAPAVAVFEALVLRDPAHLLPHSVAAVLRQIHPAIGLIFHVLWNSPVGKRNPLNICSAMNRLSLRTSKLLQTLVAKKALTPTGLEWLMASLDPYHDQEVDAPAFPDVATARTLTQTINRTVSISTPTPLTPDALWDAHIFLAPFSSPYSPVNPAIHNLSRVIVDPFGTVTAQSPAPLFPGFNALTVTPGTDWTTGGFTSYEGICLPQDTQYNLWRLTGAAYEVHNTTAILNKQGTVVTYRAPLGITHGVLDDFGGSGWTCEYGLLPPSTSSYATTFPNSRTWAAEYGVYSVSSLHTTTNPMVLPVPGTICMIQNPTQANLVAGTRLGWSHDSITYAIDSHLLPFDINGSIFTGLSGTTTLTVNVRYFLERVPTATDTTLVSLAHKSAPYDPLALEIYSRCLNELPSGVQVGQNALGAWFDQVMEIISSVLGIGGTVAGLINPGIGLG